MPKIIEDVKNTILTEAKRQLNSEGYSGMTLRSVASGCGIAVGTIYNYFKSKDTLIAAFMLDDWLEALTEMKTQCASAELPAEVFGCIYRRIADYAEKYTELFSDINARRSRDSVYAERHSLLRLQVVSLIKDTCRKNAIHYTDYLPEFIAEAILFHASEQRDFSALSEILTQLFKATPNDSLQQ